MINNLEPFCSLISDMKSLKRWEKLLRSWKFDCSWSESVKMKANEFREIFDADRESHFIRVETSLIRIFVARGSIGLVAFLTEPFGRQIRVGTWVVATPKPQLYEAFEISRK